MEPVSLELFNSYAKLNSAEDATVIGLFISAAREAAEKYTGLDFVSKTKTVTYSINQIPAIPLESVKSVSGFYNTLEAVADAYDYFNEYRKGITINRDYPIDYDNLPTYSLTYDLVVNPEDVPASIKIAIAKIAADLCENRESTSQFTNKELSISHKTLLAAYRINL